MTPEELIENCVECINISQKTGTKPEIALEVPEGDPRSSYRQPFGPNGPKGKVLTYGIPDGKDICVFDAIDLLAFTLWDGIIP